MKENTVKLIDRTVSEKQIPLFDVIAYRDHREIFRHTAGVKPATGREKLWLFSCTKPLTATCALRLIGDGKLSLDDPVKKYLPVFGKVFITDSDGNHVPPAREMKIRHLLSMSAGFSYNLNAPAIRAVRERTGNTADTRTVIEAMAEDPLLFSPGDRFEYSLCHDVLAAVIEQASGMRFSEYMKKIIFDPLGMENSGFSPEVLSPLAPLYQYNGGKVVPAPTNNVYRLTENYESGGAGLISCAEDYIRFADALACGGSGILRPETAELFRQDLMPQLAVNNFGCAQGPGYGYGTGVRIRTVPSAGGIPVGEFGWDGAAGCYVMIEPESRLSVFIASDVFGWPPLFDGAHLAVAESIYREFI